MSAEPIYGVIQDEPQMRQASQAISSLAILGRTVDYMDPADDEVRLPGGFVQALARAGSMPALLSAARDWLPRMLGAHRGSVALPFDGDNLEVLELGQPLVVGAQTKLGIRSSIVGQAYASGTIVNVGELADLDPRLASEAVYLMDAGLRSALVCPLVSGGRSLGTLNLGAHAPHYFTARHEALVGSIADLIASFMSVHQLAEEEKRRARTDTLTGCLNRGAILETLNASFRNRTALPSVLYLDIDAFKWINDHHGHQHGDETLRVLCQRLQQLLTEHETLGRLGGDEFLIVVNDDCDGQRAAKLAERISIAASRPVVIRAIESQTSLSIGVASPESAQSTAEELLHDADLALYAAKNSPGAIATANCEIRARARMIETVDRDIDLGLNTDSVVYHYQPICDLETGTVVGAEALVRWQHWEVGAIPAPLLIERIAATGRTDVFTRWSLRAVIGDWMTVRDHLGANVARSVSINLTPGQLMWSRYADFHLATLEEYGIAPEEVRIEVVESSEIENGSVPENTLRRLANAGVLISLDDFGTGHNALSYFTRFPVHGMKFDRSLIGAMEGNPFARRLINGAAAMAENLGVETVAEGIETAAELALCRQAKIPLGQGWHFGRPVPLKDFIEQFIEPSTVRRPLVSVVE